MLPLLAETADLNTLKFPVYTFPKIDGVRGLVFNGTMFSRRLKPFPNECIQGMLKTDALNGFDGELILGDNPRASDRLCNRTSGALMRASHLGPFTFWLFDIQRKDWTFERRYECLLECQEQGLFPEWAQVIKGELVQDRERLEGLEEQWVAEGYEGVVLRNPNGHYKHGRTTQSQALMLRLCRSKRSEAKVIGFIESLANENEAQVSETGHTKRSTMKSGLRPKDTLGALRVVDLTSGEEFTVGTGFDDKLRKTIWTSQNEWLGKIITYSFKPHGSDKKPRHPVFISCRLEIDL